MRSAAGAGPEGPAYMASRSPTLSVQATYGGVILGTAAYMSPEQSRGKPVDRRTDIWAFGCVLYEMLTGKQAFATGDTISDAVAAILKSDPDWTALPAGTPPSIRKLLRRCLEHDGGPEGPPYSFHNRYGSTRTVFSSIRSFGVSPVRGACSIASTAGIPSTTRPNAVY